MTAVTTGAINLAGALVDGALERGWGPRVALREGERSWSYDELREQVARIGAGLLSLGLEPGARVAVITPDCLEEAAAVLGAVYAGLVAVPLSELGRPSDLRDCLNDSGAACAVVHSHLEPALDEVRSEIPSLREVVVVGASRPGERDFHGLALGCDPLPAAAPPKPSDVALILYSAGAREVKPRQGPDVGEGQLVGIPHTHGTPLAAFASFGQGVIDLRPGDRVFSVVRLSSAFGLGTGLLFPVAAGCESVLLSEQPRSSRIFEVLRGFDPTVMVATPSVYSQLARDAEAQGIGAPLARVRLCLSGAEDMPRQVLDRASDILGARVTVGYEITEAFQFVLVGDTGASASQDGCGRPVPGFELRVVGENGEPVGADEIGTLEVRGDTLARRYWGEDEVPRGDTDWFTTRDRFMVDAGGNYYHCGRADDLFKVSGRWVAPAEVERALLANEAVWECAVIGIEDEDGLTKPLAFVVPNIGRTPGPELESALRGYVKRVLAPYKYPRWIEFVDRLPKGPSGKLLRYKLRAPERPLRAPTAKPE